MKRCIVIRGRYKNGKVEDLDQAENPADADYLVREYRMAFGSDWTIWSTHSSFEDLESHV